MANLSVIDTFNQSYFDSKDMDLFYRRVSGEHTHCGIFEHPNEDVYIAKKRTTEYMTSLLTLDRDSHLLDLGSGYGGAARYIAKEFGCQVSCINLSEQQNAINIERNQEEELSDLVHVHQGSFEKFPFPNSTFNGAWAQDSFYYSDTQLQGFREAHRVLVKGGEFIACTYFFSGNYPSPEEVNKVVNWYTGGGIHKVYFLHIDDYRKVADEIGMAEVQVIELTHHISVNYLQILKKMKEIQADEQLWSDEFFEKKKQRLLDCAEVGKSGLLQWGILHYRKEN
ncbi:class I SAM-dependent methyltransferase [Moorena sp. SIO3I8]|uniref:SAM-dependent methyltransferase n=1 Tax=Moorena sp. SIO3I8 TaxID=2607833 RepID=UPI0013C0472A|nr:class I SAM-dependent methyltransferase [Moorena sp. SIO3I8]NEO07835.1 methyltransferase domain-containing protein [Moorena sp. SIO3I8]